MTFSQFMELFPDSDTCVEYLRQKFHPDGSACPKCGRRRSSTRSRVVAAFSCQFCGHQVYPTAGTIFHKSSTSLQLWFWAVYLVSSTRCGISAKQLEREIGVSYPTAHRMFKQIRTLLGQDDEQLTRQGRDGRTYVGGKPRVGSPLSTAAQHMRRKAVVFGAIGAAAPYVASVIEQLHHDARPKVARKYVLPESTVFTDELAPVHQQSARRTRPTTASATPKAHVCATVT